MTLEQPEAKNSQEEAELSVDQQKMFDKADVRINNIVYGGGLLQETIISGPVVLGEKRHFILLRKWGPVKPDSVDPQSGRSIDTVWSSYLGQ